MDISKVDILVKPIFLNPLFLNPKLAKLEMVQIRYGGNPKWVNPI